MREQLHPKEQLGHVVDTRRSIIDFSWTWDEDRKNDTELLSGANRRIVCNLTAHPPLYPQQRTYRSHGCSSKPEEGEKSQEPH